MLTTDIMKAQLGALQAGLKESSYGGFFGHAERWFRDEIGPELYSYIAGLSSATGEDAELLRLAQSCLAWYAYSLAFPHQKFRVSELGLMKTSPQNAIAVTKWEYIDTKDANLSMLDLSLEYFWREVEVRKPAAWTSSPAYAERNRHFLRSAAELAAVLPIAGRNYRFFQKLVPFIGDVEWDIRAVLTTEEYLVLKLRWQDAGAVLTPVEEQLISRIRKATAYLAVFNAWAYLPLTMDELGIGETRSKDGINESVTPDGKLRSFMRQQLYNDGQRHLNRIREFLDETATPLLFPAYYLANLAPSATHWPADDFTDKPHVIL